jgi:hypothetical protein
MNIQDLIDGANARNQRERAATQMTLGKMIEALEAFPTGATVQGLKDLDSYRGYYSDLAFELGDEPVLASDLLATCKAAMGRVFQGYKGGDYMMGALTPLWIANYGCCGQKLITINPDGSIETTEDE